MNALATGLLAAILMAAAGGTAQAEPGRRGPIADRGSSYKAERVEHKRRYYYRPYYAARYYRPYVYRRYYRPYYYRPYTYRSYYYGPYWYGQPYYYGYGY